MDMDIAAGYSGQTGSVEGRIAGGVRRGLGVLARVLKSLAVGIGITAASPIVLTLFIVGALLKAIGSTWGRIGQMKRVLLMMGALSLGLALVVPADYTSFTDPVLKGVIYSTVLYALDRYAYYQVDSIKVYLDHPLCYMVVLALHAFGWAHCLGGL